MVRTKNRLQNGLVMIFWIENVGPWLMFTLLLCLDISLVKWILNCIHIHICSSVDINDNQMICIHILLYNLNVTYFLDGSLDLGSKIIYSINLLVTGTCSYNLIIMYTRIIIAVRIYVK